jgi:hypothetical protein
MPECPHTWEMTNIRFGFVVFEKCHHCGRVRTFFTREDIALLGDKYREGTHFWSRVENAQSFRFDLRCRSCGMLEKFDDLMGLLYCTACRPECKVDILRRELEAQGTHVVLACGFLTENRRRPEQVAGHKIEMLASYFNQRRDVSRSRIAVLPFDLEDGLSHCMGEFLHDVGMISQEPPEIRKTPLWQ